MALLRIEPHIVDTIGNFVFQSATVTANITTGNASLGNLASANYFSGNGSLLTSINGSNITGQAANALVAGTVYTNEQPNITSVGTLTSLGVTGNVSAAYFIGNGSQLTGLPAGYTDSDANSAIDARVTKTFVENLGINGGAIVSATAPGSPNAGDLWLDSDTGDISVFFGNAWAALTTQAATAQTVTANAQPNITSVGTLTSLVVSGNVTANHFIGDGSLLTGLPAGYTDANANSAIDAYVTKTFIDNLNVDADTLDGHDSTYFATSTQGGLADTALQPGDNVSDLINDAGYLVTANISTVGITGNYADLTNKPTLFDGEYTSLANKPTLFSGSYADLTNKPTLGTAAATASTDYATAAQGIKADTALQPADLTGYATESYVSDAIANLVDSAPTTLDTLNELAAALGDDPSFATSIASSIGNKLSTSDFTSTADTWLATKSTTNLSEGTNQYYTVARANSAIDARVTKTFVDNLGVVANIANIAYSVAVGNVTGIGNIATLNLDGNASTILYGNGTFAAAPVTYNDSNVGSYLPTYTGNLSPSNLLVSTTANLGAVGNITITGGNSGQVLSTDGTGILSWIDQSATAQVSTTISVDNFTGNGVATMFTLSVAPTSVNSIFVNYNGVLLGRSSYEINGANLTFGSIPANGSKIEVTTIQGLTIGSGAFTTRTATGDGSETDYTVTSGATVSSVLVTIDGVLQTPTTDYTISGSTLTFTTAPYSGGAIQIRELSVASSSGSGSALLIQEEGTNLTATANTINFVGGGVTATNVDNVVTVTIPSASITVKDEGTTLTSSATSIDFTGTAVTATNVGGAVTVDVSGTSNTSIRAQAMTMGIIFGG